MERTAGIGPSTKYMAAAILVSAFAVIRCEPFRGDLAAGWQPTRAGARVLIRSSTRH